MDASTGIGYLQNQIQHKKLGTTKGKCISQSSFNLPYRHFTVKVSDCDVTQETISFHFPIQVFMLNLNFFL